jgi:hypothetical protein
MRFVMGQDRSQSTLFPALFDDYIGDDNPVRAIDVFVDELRLGDLGFDGVQPLDLAVCLLTPPRPKHDRRTEEAYIVAS